MPIKRAQRSLRASLGRLKLSTTVGACKVGKTAVKGNGTKVLVNVAVARGKKVQQAEEEEEKVEESGLEPEEEKEEKSELGDEDDDESDASDNSLGSEDDEDASFDYEVEQDGVTTVQHESKDDELEEPGLVIVESPSHVQKRQDLNREVDLAAESNRVWTERKKSYFGPEELAAMDKSQRKLYDELLVLQDADEDFLRKVARKSDDPLVAQCLEWCKVYAHCAYYAAKRYLIKVGLWTKELKTLDRDALDDSQAACFGDCLQQLVQMNHAEMLTTVDNFYPGAGSRFLRQCYLWAGRDDEQDEDELEIQQMASLLLEAYDPHSKAQQQRSSGRGRKKQVWLAPAYNNLGPKFDALFDPCTDPSGQAARSVTRPTARPPTSPTISSPYQPPLAQEKKAASIPKKKKKQKEEEVADTRPDSNATPSQANNKKESIRAARRVVHEGEGDKNVGILKQAFEELCSLHFIPDLHLAGYVIRIEQLDQEHKSDTTTFFTESEKIIIAAQMQSDMAVKIVTGCQYSLLRERTADLDWSMKDVFRVAGCKANQFGNLEYAYKIWKLWPRFALVKERFHDIQGRVTAMHAIVYQAVRLPDMIDVQQHTEVYCQYRVALRTFLKAEELNQLNDVITG